MAVPRALGRADWKVACEFDLTWFYKDFAEGLEFRQSQPGRQQVFCDDESDWRPGGFYAGSS